MQQLLKNIGFIGLGNMGSKMAINLSKAGYKVQGYDINEDIMTSLEEFGIEKSISLSTYRKKAKKFPSFFSNQVFVMADFCGKSVKDASLFKDHESVLSNSIVL